jgi:hypothetical protein
LRAIYGWRVRTSRLPLALSLLALFVALGGPAEAGRLLGKGSVDSRAIKNRTIKTRDLRNLAVTEAKIANGAVTPGKLAPGAVGSDALADRSLTAADLGAGSVGTAALADRGVTGAKVADGSLDSRDVGRFSGRFRSTVPAIPPGSCWSGEPAQLAPEQAGADISADVVLVTPDDTWDERRVTFAVRASEHPSRFVMSGCNLSDDVVEPHDVSFSYVVLGLP